MKRLSGMLICLTLMGLVWPQVSNTQSIEDLNRKFEESTKGMLDQHEKMVSQQNTEFEARQREMNRLFEAARDKVLNLFGDDPAKAKAAVWQGEQEQAGRKEVKLEPNLRVEVSDAGQGKIEVTAVTVPAADTETARKQAGQEAADIAKYKLAERVREVIQSQSPAGQIDPERVSKLVETALQHSEPVFARDKAPEQQPVCYLKAQIPIFNNDSGQPEKTVESILNQEAPKMPPRKMPPGVKPEYVRQPVKKGPCTGLIIDATEKGFTGGAVIMIFSEDDPDYAIYAIQVARQRDKGVSNMYGHCASLDTARTVSRVTSNPIILPAKKVQQGTAIILSRDDAYALTVANQNNFLSQGRVIIVYEGGKDAKK